jgi:hypothetical protein
MLDFTAGAHLRRECGGPSAIREVDDGAPLRQVPDPALTGGECGLIAAGKRTHAAPIPAT